MEIPASVRYSSSVPAERITDELLNVISSSYLYSATVRAGSFSNTHTSESRDRQRQCQPADWHIQTAQENIFQQPKPNIMILNADEEVVMASDNKQIVLTTKRIIQESKNATKSIDLKDYKAYEIVRKRNNYYLYFLPFPVIISLFAVAIVMVVLVVLLLLFLGSNSGKVHSINRGP